MTENEKKSLNPLKVAMIAFTVITLVYLFTTGYYVFQMNNQMNTLQKEYSQKYDKMFEIMQKTQPQNKATQIINMVKENTPSSHDFSKNYYEVQSNWLNAWLMIVAVIVGAMGIAFPVIAVGKITEFDNLIKEAKESKNEMDNFIKDSRSSMEGILAETKASEAKTKESESIAEAYAYVSTGNKFVEEKQYSLALDYYNKAREKNPNDAETSKKIAELTDITHIIESFTKALELRDSAENYYGRGEMYSRLKDYDKAIIDYDKAIKLNDKLPPIVYYNASEAYIFSEEPKFDKALKLLNLFKQDLLGPCISEVDYCRLITALNKHPENSDVQEILKIIDTLK